MSIMRDLHEMEQTREENHLAAIRAEGHSDVVSLLRTAARHAHKGPDDTDASMLLAAATRLRGGYEPGGSNTKQTVARVCELVASLIEDAPAPVGSDEGSARG